MAARKLPVTGLDELERFLTALPANLRRNAVNSGLRAAAKVMRDEIRLRAPKRTGLLAKSIGYGSPRRLPDGNLAITVGPRNARQGGNNHAFLAPLIEYGTAAHIIRLSHADAAEVNSRLKPSRSRNGRSRSTLVSYANRMDKAGSLKIGGAFVGPVVQHPGSAPHPFIRPAFDANAGDAVQAFKDQITAWAMGKLTRGTQLDEAA